MSTNYDVFSSRGVRTHLVCLRHCLLSSASVLNWIADSDIVDVMSDSAKMFPCTWSVST